MSCWVVPAVAANLWGVSVDQVMRSIADGQVVWKREYEFLLVDVAPDSPVLPPPQAKPQRPRTYVPVLRQVIPLATADSADLPPQIDDEPPLDDETDYAGDAPFDWRLARASAARLRVRTPCT